MDTSAAMLQPETLHKNPCCTSTSAHCPLHPPPVLAGKDGMWIQEMTTDEKPKPNLWAIPDL